MAIGPLEFVVIGYKGDRFTSEIVPELNSIQEKGLIRVVDLIFARKDTDGTVKALEVHDLNDEELAALERAYGVRIADGAYWYDTRCGAWGWQGGPCAGLIHPGLNLGGPFRSDASNGNTGVFINGRQLHYADVLRLQELGPVQMGSYWLDAQGNFGWEGGPMLGNLFQLAQMKRASNFQGGGVSRDNFWSTSMSAGNYDPVSGAGYVSVPGYGPVGYG